MTVHANCVGPGFTADEPAETLGEALSLPPDFEKVREQVEPLLKTLPDAPEGLRLLENIGVKLTVEVGRAELTIRDLLRLSEGSVIELDRLAGDPLDVLLLVVRRDDDEDASGHRSSLCAQG